MALFYIHDSGLCGFLTIYEWKSDFMRECTLLCANIAIYAWENGYMREYTNLCVSNRRK